ncbi:TPA: glycosyltransferase family 4 protein [Candidatus Micrarchaeota archaeon]|nr:glycosyltransferase family 4 protein [Candidatus Micrarchaeota archaeon]HIH30579.1 glycosyltransferase family 4 protein [Candidatus Micrarchaeota archaeon]
MRIAHIAPFDPFSTLGGQERMVSDLVGWQMRNGHKTQIFSLSPEQSKKWTKFGHLPAIELLKRKLPDFSDFDIVHAHGWAFEPVFAAKPKAPVLATVYGTIAQYMQNVNLPAWRKAYLSLTQLRYEKNACKNATALASLCAKQNAEMQKHYGCGRAKPINCGIDTGFFTKKDKAKSRRRLGLEANSRIALACGRMSVAHKGFDILLKLAESMPQGSILVVNGTVPESLKSKMKPNMVARTTKWEEMPYLYSAADVFVHPSRYEGFGLATCEAMACGTPAVAFDTGAAGELLWKEEGGMLVSDTGNSDGFVRAALKLLSDKELCAKKGRVASKKASRYTVDAMGKEYFEYYQEIVGK